MSPWIHRYKPAASVRAQVMLAALLWTLVGSGMFVAGTVWSRSMHWPWLALFVATASIVGVVKARLAMGKTARRLVDRICLRGDGRCLGGFLSWRMWLFVGGMMLLGRFLRTGVLPLTLVAFVYQAVGIALLVGAISLWRAYSHLSQST